MLPLYDKYKQIQKEKLYGSPNKENTEQILTQSLQNDQQQNYNEQYQDQTNEQPDNQNIYVENQSARSGSLVKSSPPESPQKQQLIYEQQDEQQYQQMPQQESQNYYQSKKQKDDEKQTVRKVEKQNKQQTSSRGFQNALNKINPKQNTLGIISLSQSIITPGKKNNINNMYPNLNQSMNSNSQNKQSNSSKKVNQNKSKNSINMSKNNQSSKKNIEDLSQSQNCSYFSTGGKSKTVKDYLNYTQEFSYNQNQNKNAIQKAQEKQLSQQMDTINTLLYSENLFSELFSQSQLLTKFTCNANANNTCNQSAVQSSSTIKKDKVNNQNNTNNLGNSLSINDINGLNTSNYSAIQHQRDQNQRGHTMSSLNLYSQGQSQFTTPKAQKNYINKVAHMLKSANQQQDLSLQKSFCNEKQVTLKDIMERETKYQRNWIQDDSILDKDYKQHCLNNSQTQIKFSQQVNNIQSLKKKQGNNQSQLKSLERNSIRSSEKIIKEYNQFNSEQRVNLYQSFNSDAKISSYSIENSMNKSMVRYSEVNNSHCQNVNKDKQLQKQTLNGKCIHNLKSMYCTICSRKINSNNQSYQSIKV